LKGGLLSRNKFLNPGGKKPTLHSKERFLKNSILKKMTLKKSVYKKYGKK